MLSTLVAQIIMTSTQFKVAYGRMAEVIQKSADLHNLAVALNLEDETNVEESLRKHTEAMRNPEYGALIGMDMHPRQNAFQVFDFFHSLLLRRTLL